ncbi:MAG: class I SAM-dependent methyltransferase [candidate division NC10 bacterium]|nr:class I SAM-dependent methyltransferase [candidate division NC10 bacterium]
MDAAFFAHCRGCGADVASPQPDPVEQEAFYRNRYFGHFGASEASAQRLDMLRSLLGRIPRRPPGRWLDVGCGAGHLLAMARTIGWDIAGVDPCIEACRVAQARYGLKVKAVPLEDADLPEGAFDVVTLINVLDQAPNPVALLGAVRRVLGAKGLLVVRIPNGAFHRAVWEMIRHTPSRLAHRLHALVIFHPFNLNARALACLLRTAGFGLVHIHNAPISGADWLSPRGGVTRLGLAGLTAVGRTLAGTVAALTAGHLLCAPSLLAFAEPESRG